MGPEAAQPGDEVAELGEFDLQAAFEGEGALGEDVENELGAVDDADLEDVFECAALSGGMIGHHGIAGIGPGFIPSNYNPYVVDSVLAVSTSDAERAAREVLFFDGVPACTSAGAVLVAATQLVAAGKSQRPRCIFAGRRTYE